MTGDWNNTARRVVSAVSAARSDLQILGARKGASKAAAVVFGVEKIVSALEQFPECVRYLNTRRSKGAVVNINSESDVQDAIFLMLRPWVTDLVPENPTDKIASRYSIKDFISKELESVVEAKYIRDKKHGREISRELHDDIEMYRSHPSCKHLVFFIYDRDSLIPDVAALRRQVEVVRDYSGKKLQVFCVVKP